MEILDLSMVAISPRLMTGSRSIEDIYKLSLNVDLRCGRMVDLALSYGRISGGSRVWGIEEGGDVVSGSISGGIWCGILLRSFNVDVEMIDGEDLFGRVCMSSSEGMMCG